MVSSIDKIKSNKYKPYTKSVKKKDPEWTRVDKIKIECEKEQLENINYSYFLLLLLLFVLLFVLLII